MMGVSDMADDVMHSIAVDSAKGYYADPQFRMVPPIIKTTGQLMYVVWVYPDSTRQDSVYTIHKRSTAEEKSAQVPEYYLGKFKVDRATYDSFTEGEMLYTTADGEVVSKDAWDFYRLQDRLGKYAEHKPGPIVQGAKQQIRYHTSITQTQVPLPVLKKWYDIIGVYCVTFDASSGRVVTKGYQPVTLQERYKQ